MQRQDFAEWLRQLDSLSPSQWQQLHARLEQPPSSEMDAGWKRILRRNAPTAMPTSYAPGARPTDSLDIGVPRATAPAIHSLARPWPVCANGPCGRASLKD